MRLLKFLLVFCLSFSILGLLFIPSYTKAESCSDENDPEFHSLRPYPAEPCNDKKEDLSYICGNDMVLTDNIKAFWTQGDCVESGGLVGTLTCDFDLKRGFTVEVDPSQSELPIMGNTEDVTPNADPDMPDVQKVTEYVSWYLNGVINRAEYAFLKWNDPDDIKKLVNLSGPIRKLLPQRIQDNKSLVAITGIIEAAATREKQVDDAASVRHNQIVGCTWGLNTPLGQILALPGPCKITNNPILSLLLDLTVREKHRLKEWKDQIPPKREDFPEYKDYYIAYKEWRGKECKHFPIGGFEIVWCYNDPGEPDYYANMYPYIPFSSTEDRVGDLEVKKPVKTGGDVEAVDPVFDICREEDAGVSCFPGDPNHGPWDLDKLVNNSALHFAHMQEDKELSLTLQSTFVPKDGTDQEPGYAEPPQIGPGCKILDVRSNPGDKLDPYPYPKDDKEVSLGRFSYRAQFTCTFSYYYDAAGIRHVSPPFCIKQAIFTSKINVGSPLADEIWAQTVAGNSAIFKMIFPKLNVAGSPGSIKDIPGVTPIVYDSRPYITAAADVDPKNPEIYFPHIGGVYEYFLKGIQTILRPKGYGEKISFGKGSSGTCGGIPNLPAGSGACKLTSTTINGITLPPTLVSIIEAAAQSYNVPPGLILGVMFGEGAFNNPSNWTENNVQNWSMGCAVMPNCNPNSFPSTGVVPFYETYWNQLQDAVAVVDPNREPNPCNLLDAIFALAKDLNRDQNGSGAFNGKTCYGIALNAGSGGSASCSWDSSDYETAIRVWELGTAYNSTYTCATKAGGCSAGGMASVCPGGDLCETVGSSGNTSHNACVWNVAHSH